MHSRLSFLSAAGSAAAASALARPARAQAATIRIGAPPGDTSGAPFYAEAAGAFARAGFDIEVSSMANAGAVAAALAGGAIDLGLGDLVSSTNAIIKGLPIELVAGCGLYRASAPNGIIGVAKDSPVRGPRDLEGKSLSVPTLVGITTAAVRACSFKTGVDADKVRIIELTSSTAPAAILRGTVAAGLLTEPSFTPIRDRFRDIGHPFDVIANQFLLSAWFASRAWVEADHQRAKRVISAIYDTQRWANTHHDETLVILASTMKLDIEQIRLMTRTLFATQLLTSDVQPILNIAERSKLIDRPVAATSMLPKL